LAGFSIDGIFGEKASVKPMAVGLRRDVDDPDHHLPQEHVIGASHHHPERNAG
jgi:hypothetical protein